MNGNAKLFVASLADRQFGRVSVTQLQTAGIRRNVIKRWADAGYLHLVLPRVYAVGHRASSVEADLAAALLYAGPGAMLSHATAAWWWGLIDEPPPQTHVTTPRRCESLPSVRVHGRRDCERVWRNGLTVTTVAQALLDYSASCTPRRLRRALAEADYRGLLSIAQVEEVLAPGRRGGMKLRRAIEQHRPELAKARSVLEERFIELCERHHLPLPAMNVWIEGFLVDATWLDRRVVVELDGSAAHSSPERLHRDRERDLALRRAGYTVLRYSWKQVIRQAELVAADLRAALSWPEQSAGSGSR